MIAISGSYSRNASAYSSASTTACTPLPSRALPPRPGESPPSSTSGSSPPSTHICASRAVLVVLPWLPATASTSRSASSHCTICALESTCTPRSRAASSSGLSLEAAAVATTSSARPRLEGAWPW